MNGSDQKEQALLNRINQELDRAESSLDADTLRELRLARSRAMESLHKPRQLWQPLGTAALAAAIAALAVSLHINQYAEVEPVSKIEDISLLGTSDELELYENLEFYQWLESEGRGTGPV